MKQHKRWLYLLLAGGILLEVSACTQKEPAAPSAYKLKLQGVSLQPGADITNVCAVSCSNPPFFA